MSIVTKIIRAPWDLYSWTESISDPRTKDWPLCKSPFPILFIMVAYVCFAKIIGPKLMEKRKPFRLQPLMTTYNAFMVIVSAFFFLYGGSYTYFGKYDWICEPVDYNNGPSTVVLRNLAWWYMMLRLFEMMDTVFFVLRKKTRQISKLHVIHHSIIPFDIWIGVKFGVASGSNVFFPFINCFVHVVMYSYYFLASLGPSMRKCLWWKRYLTILQIVQFVVILLHAVLPFFFDCGFNVGFSYLIASEATLFMTLFMNFYVITYKSEKSELSSDTVHLNGKGPEGRNSHIQMLRKGGMKEH